MENQTFSIIAIVVLLVINAFFVAAEFALVKAKSFRIDLLADQGSKSAILTQKIQINLESYLAACQLGITMASLGLGWVGEPVVAALLEPVFHAIGLPENLLHPLSFILGFLIFSSLHIVVGEQVPKTFAIRKAEPVSMWCAYPLHWFYMLAYPLNWLLNRASGAILGWFNVEEATHADVLSDAEIRGIIDTSEKHGDMNAGKAGMLHNMFEFDTHSVQQIMVPRSETDVIDLQAPWDETLKFMLETQHSRYPVFDGSSESPIGILLVKDLYNAMLGQEEQPEPLEAVRSIIRECLLVPETQPVSDLFESMRKNRTHMALAIDEYGSFAGAVTMEDILEEIVGEISDELDIDEADSPVVRVDDHWEADGLVSITDLERAVHVDFDNNIESNTISGLFMTQLSRMPNQGDEIIENGLRFVALDIENNRVGNVHIFSVNPATEPAVERAADKPDETSE